MGSFYLTRRGYERIAVNIPATYLYNNESLAGSVRNLSINGMCIEAENDLPFRSNIDVLNPFKSYGIVYVPFREKTLKVIVNVRRIVREDDGDVTCLGVELVNPSQDYLEFVSFIRNYCRITSLCQSLPHIKNSTI